MKRAFTQKVKSVPSGAADNDALAELSEGKLPEGVASPVRPTSLEVNRRARTSAAMIGLAISMGASSLLLPRQGDEAMASEPVATEPATAGVPTVSEQAAVVSHAMKVEPEAAVISASKNVEQTAEQTTTPPTVEYLSAAVPRSLASDLLPVGGVNSHTQQSLVIEHEVKPGQTIWNLSQKYQVDAAAIAAANKPVSSSVLPPGKVLKVPVVNGIVHEVRAGDTVETISSSYGVAPAQLQMSSGTIVSGSLPLGESVVIPGNVNSLLKARQKDALNNLREHRNRLQNSLAELGSEESTNTPNGSSSVTKEDQTATAPPPAVEADVPMVTAPQQMVTLPSPGISPVPSPMASATSPMVVPPSSVSIPSPGISPMPSPVTPAVSPSISHPSATLPSPGISPVLSPATPTAQGSVVLPSSVTSSNLVNGSAKQPTGAATPEVRGPFVVEPQVAEKGDIYQVKPGDTLGEIARSHGVSSAEIIQLNRLENPNLIQVNQKLAIPQSQPLASLSHLNSTSSAALPRQTGVGVPSLAVPNLSNTVVVPVVQQGPLSSSKKGTAPTAVEATVSTPTVLVAREASQSSNSQSDTTNNPYVDKLREEIFKLRAQYRSQQDGGQFKTGANVPVPPVTLTVPVPSNNAPASLKYINPEFNPNRYNDALQRENHSLSSQKQPSESGPIEIKVPLPDRPKQGVVATAPTGTEMYNPSMQIRPGQSVSPELPPLNPIEGPNNLQQLTTSFMWPTKGVLTSGFGMRWGRMHKGIDIAAPVGTPVMAAASGVVVYARWNSGGYGNLVDIQHPDGSLTRYAHNHRILVREGEQVEQGQQISLMGSTGFSTGPHCHFEVHPPGKGAVNPIAYLPSHQ